MNRLLLIFFIVINFCLIKFMKNKIIYYFEGRNVEENHFFLNLETTKMQKWGKEKRIFCERNWKKKSKPYSSVTKTPKPRQFIPTKHTVVFVFSLGKKKLRASVKATWVIFSLNSFITYLSLSLWPAIAWNMYDQLSHRLVYMLVIQAAEVK